MRRAHAATRLICLAAAACSNAKEHAPVTYVDAAHSPDGDAAVISMGGDGAALPGDRGVADAAPVPLDATGPGPDAPSSPADAAGPTSDLGTEAGAADAERVDQGGGAGPDAATPPPDAAQMPPDAAVVPAGCAPAADPAPGQRRDVSPDGRFVRFPDFASRFVGARRVTVRLPPGGPQAGERLPVLYMHDGQNVFFDEEATFGVSWGAIGTTDDLAADPEGARLLVVAVDNTAARIDDYTPSVDPDRADGGDAADYGRFLVEELKPFIDFHFPTRCAAEDTGLLGSSLGGLVSLYLGASYPEVFGRVAAFSPSLWWDGGLASDWVAPLAVALADSPDRRLYLDTGNFEGDVAIGPGAAGRSTVVVDGRRFADAVVAGVPGATAPQIMLVEDPGAEHNESAWRRRLPNALRFLYGPPLGEPAAIAPDALWPWAPALRAGRSTTASVFAHDGRRDFFSVLGAAGEVTSDDVRVVSVDADGHVSPVAPGATTLHAGALSATISVAAANESIVHLLVAVPDGTTEAYLGGSLDALGPWDATALPLRALTPTLFEGFLVAPSGAAFEYKVTAGTWDAVEKDANGNDIGNRRYTPAGDADVELEVRRFGGAR